MKSSKRSLLSASGIALIGLLATHTHAQDCTTPSANDLYVDKDNSGASDSNNGRYTANGGTGPFKTIQKLVDTIAPGQCGWVRASSTPYYEPSTKSGSDYAGIIFNHGGTSDTTRIIISGYPGERPAIDQQRVLAPNGWGTTGFYIYKGDYITIRNFEIRNTSDSSIATNAGIAVNYLTVENTLLHHAYGKDNIAGVRLDACRYCVVRNNTIHDNYSTRLTSNPFTSEPYGLHTGIHGYHAGNCTIANNLIYNVGAGVFQKTVSDSNLEAHNVYGNIFVNIGSAAFQIMTYGAEAPKNARFHDNVIYNAARGVWTDNAESSQQGSVLKIYNNTFIKSGLMASITNFTGVEIYNNIVSGSTDAFHSDIGNPILFETTNPYSWVTRISYFDNNLYYATPNIWTLNRYASSGSADYTSLSAWKASSSNATMTYSTPDSKTATVDPKFVNSAAGATSLLKGIASDYGLQTSSAGISMGRYSDTIGAVRAGVAVGLLSGNSPTIVQSAPVAPSGLSVRSL